MTRRYRLEYRTEYGGPFKYFACYSNPAHALLRLRECTFGGRVVGRTTGRVIWAYSGFPMLSSIGLRHLSDGPSFGAGQVVTLDR